VQEEKNLCVEPGNLKDPIMSRSNKIEGGCICGRVAFRVEDQFATAKLCFCKFCQKASGSGHVTNAFGQPEMLEWLSGGEAVCSFDVPNSQIRRVFCPSCGTSLPFVTQNERYLIVPVGCLSRPPTMEPKTVSNWDSRPGWYEKAMKLVAAEAHD